MIFKDSPITEENVLLRFYYFGLGDRGPAASETKMYARVPLNFFKFEETKRSDGTSYYRYFLEDPKLFDQDLGKGWGYSIGYVEGDHFFLQKELSEAHEKIKILSTIKVY